MDPAMSCMTNNLCLSRNLRANDGRTRDSVRGVRGDRPDGGSACQSVARISKCSRYGTRWHALSFNSCAQFANSSRNVHESGTIVSSRQVV